MYFFISSFPADIESANSLALPAWSVKICFDGSIIYIADLQLGLIDFVVAITKDVKLLYRSFVLLLGSMENISADAS